MMRVKVTKNKCFERERDERIIMKINFFKRDIDKKKKLEREIDGRENIYIERKKYIQRKNYEIQSFRERKF